MPTRGARLRVLLPVSLGGLLGALVSVASCAFPDVDKLGKTCEGSCAPYLCIERRCVASAQDAAAPPSDAGDSLPDVRLDTSAPGPCVPKPFLPLGRIVFRDCFDDREPAKAVGLDTPWPNGGTEATLDPSMPVSSPYAMRFLSTGVPAPVNTGPVVVGSVAQIACAFHVRFDTLVDATDFFELRAILGLADLSLALSATPSGTGFTWRPRYIASFDAGTPTVTDTLVSAPRKEWTKVVVAVGKGTVTIRIGGTEQVLTTGPTVPMSQFGVLVGVIRQSGNAPQELRYDDMICDVVDVR